MHASALRFQKRADSLPARTLNLMRHSSALDASPRIVWLFRPNLVVSTDYAFEKGSTSTLHPSPSGRIECINRLWDVQVVDWNPSLPRIQPRRPEMLLLKQIFSRWSSGGRRANLLKARDHYPDLSDAAFFVTVAIERVINVKENTAMALRALFIVLSITAYVVWSRIITPKVCFCDCLSWIE